MGEPNGYIQGSNGVTIELVDNKARQELPKKLTRPATAQVGDYLRIKAIGADGTMEVEAVAAPTGGATVPTKVSAFENDAGYTTEARVQALLAEFPTFKIEVVQELPAVGAEKTIYLVPFADDSGSYLEYLYVNGAWEVVGSGSDSGENVTLTTEQINALDGMFKVCAFVQEDVSAQYNAFRAAFGLDSGDTDKTLTSISATYSGGSVPVGTAVSALTGVVVTATYDDGSTATVTGYTLSGSIAEGENTITVSYGGKTTTITVVGVASGEDSPTLETYEYSFDNPGKLVTGTGVLTTHGSYNSTGYIDLDDGADAVTLYTNPEGNYGPYVGFFAADGEFVERQIIFGAVGTYTVPVGAAKFIVTVQTTVTTLTIYKGTVTADEIGGAA